MITINHCILEIAREFSATKDELYKRIYGKPPRDRHDEDEQPEEEKKEDHPYDKDIKDVKDELLLGKRRG